MQVLHQFENFLKQSEADFSQTDLYKKSTAWPRVERLRFFKPPPGHVVATLDRTFYDDYLWFRTISKFSGQDIEEIHRSIGPSKIPYASADFSEHLNYCLSQRTMCGLCRTINMQQLQISTKRSKIYLFAHY